MSNDDLSLTGLDSLFFLCVRLCLGSYSAQSRLSERPSPFLREKKAKNKSSTLIILIIYFRAGSKARQQCSTHENFETKKSYKLGQTEPGNRSDEPADKETDKLLGKY